MNKLTALALTATVGLSGLSIAAPAMAQSMNTIPNCDASRSSYLLKNMDVVAGLLKSDGAKFGALDIWGGCIRTSVTNAAGHTEILFYDPNTLRLVGTVN
jgi:hypothetical protein